MFDIEKCEFVMMGLVGEIQYSFINRVGAILMPEMSCVDMQSAIDFFKRIDPEVEVIRCFNNGIVDLTYYYDGEKWGVALHPAKDV